MQIFLDEFALTLQEPVILVMDNAGWHNGLKVPEKIRIMYLPPYSPELNPTEKLWQYIKERILKNKCYDDLQYLEDELCAFLKQLTAPIISSVCNCSYVL
jgi:transposase